VLAAIQFNIQLRFLTKEIQMVNAARMLAAKLVAGKPPVTQPAPHQLFRPGIILAKLAGAGDVGHDGNLSDKRKREKFVLTPALTCGIQCANRDSGNFHEPERRRVSRVGRKNGKQILFRRNSLFPVDLSGLIGVRLQMCHSVQNHIPFVQCSCVCPKPQMYVGAPTANPQCPNPPPRV